MTFADTDENHLARATRLPVLVCFGTRPEVVKLAPVFARLRDHPLLRPVTVTTAQHREMLDQALADFGIVPDVDLDLMARDQPLAGLTSAAIGDLGDAVRRYAPAAVVVQGDTTTALCAALAGFYARVPVAHVEAGLRTWDRHSPFPEEVNRRMIASLADWHFCPTREAAANLEREGVAPADTFVTGNTVVDALHGVLLDAPITATLPPRRAARRIVVTMHRRETQGAAHRGLLRMLARVVAEHDVELVMPVHLSPSVRAMVHAELGGRDRVHLTEPMDYRTFIALVRTSDVVVSDSGGLQEEAPALGVPLLVTRETTERPEAVAAGCVRLCGVDPDVVERALLELLADDALAARMSSARSPFGDGRAAIRIVDAIAQRVHPDLRVPAASRRVDRIRPGLAPDLAMVSAVKVAPGSAGVRTVALDHGTATDPAVLTAVVAPIPAASTTTTGADR